MEIYPILLLDFLEKDNLIDKKYSVFIFVLFALILGGLASSNTSQDIWYQNLSKSYFNPPGYVFGIVWPILYFLISLSAYRVFNSVYKLFYVQLFFNAMWSWLFFSFHLPLVALIDICLLIFLNIKLMLIFLKLDKFSLLLYLPYVLWLCFACYLNLFIVINN